MIFYLGNLLNSKRIQANIYALIILLRQQICCEENGNRIFRISPSPIRIDQHPLSCGVWFSELRKITTTTDVACKYSHRKWRSNMRGKWTLANQQTPLTTSLSVENISNSTYCRRGLARNPFNYCYKMTNPRSRITSDYLARLIVIIGHLRALNLMNGNDALTITVYINILACKLCLLPSQGMSFSRVCLSFFGLDYTNLYAKASLRKECSVHRIP